MAELRKGGSPTITKGEHAGDSVALDHVLPRAVVPELAARFYNLEAIPAKANLAKSAKVGQRELDPPATVAESRFAVSGGTGSGRGGSDGTAIRQLIRVDKDQLRAALWCKAATTRFAASEIGNDCAR